MNKLLLTLFIATHIAACIKASQTNLTTAQKMHLAMSKKSQHDNEKKKLE